MNKKELKPCPFCGHKAKLRECLYDDYYIKRYYIVHCIKCNGSVGNSNSCLTEEEAIENWNKRV